MSALVSGEANPLSHLRSSPSWLSGLHSRSRARPLDAAMPDNPPEQLLSCPPEASSTTLLWPVQPPLPHRQSCHEQLSPQVLQASSARCPAPAEPMPPALRLIVTSPASGGLAFLLIAPGLASVQVLSGNPTPLPGDSWPGPSCQPAHPQSRAAAPAPWPSGSRHEMPASRREPCLSEALPHPLPLQPGHRQFGVAGSASPSACYTFSATAP
mmetsp:Transcript_25510/g.59408  ORF Transcript_25510/g.59408 Transcript_25510/m.59408 type:complete len:212 (-) Transcript_25510:593-1228(-)